MICRQRLTALLTVLVLGGCSAPVAAPETAAIMTSSGPAMTDMPMSAAVDSGPATAAGSPSGPKRQLPSTTTGSTTAPPVMPTINGLTGMPAVSDAHNIYAAAGAGQILDRLRSYPAYAYVPHNKSGDVWIIDQHTMKVVRKCPVGVELQHVVPSYDMSMLYATDDLGNAIRAIDPATGQCGATIPVRDPYNMYFTPDGRYAISVAERDKELVWYDPVTWQIHDTTSVPDCAGIDHAEFSVDGRIAVFTCEFAGRVVVVDVTTHAVLRSVEMPIRNTMMGPQDIKLAPDGSVYYIADSDSNGIWVLDGTATQVLRHIPTGSGAHGLYLSRDATKLYVSNRLEGSVSVLDAYTGAALTKWVIPGGGSPDMGNVSADGSQLWLSGRYNNVVYVIDTTDGHLIATIPVGIGPHGMTLMPLPGRYCLGHTGITR